MGWSAFKRRTTGINDIFTQKLSQRDIVAMMIFSTVNYTVVVNIHVHSYTAYFLTWTTHRALWLAPTPPCWRLSAHIGTDRRRPLAPLGSSSPARRQTGRRRIRTARLRHRSPADRSSDVPAGRHGTTANRLCLCRRTTGTRASPPCPPGRPCPAVWRPSGPRPPPRRPHLRTHTPACEKTALTMHYILCIVTGIDLFWKLSVQSTYWDATVILSWLCLVWFIMLANLS